MGNHGGSSSAMARRGLLGRFGIGRGGKGAGGDKGAAPGTAMVVASGPQAVGESAARRWERELRRARGGDARYQPAGVREAAHQALDPEVVRRVAAEYGQSEHDAERQIRLNIASIASVPRTQISDRTRAELMASAARGEDTYAYPPISLEGPLNTPWNMWVRGQRASIPEFEDAVGRTVESANPARLPGPRSGPPGPRRAGAMARRSFVATARAAGAAPPHARAPGGKAGEVARAHESARAWQAAQAAAGARPEDVAEARPGADGRPGGLVPVVRAGEVPLDRDNFPGSVAHARDLLAVYGPHQFGKALNQYSLDTIRELAGHLDIAAKGRSRADLLTLVTHRMTNGRYSAEFGKLTPSGKPAGAAPRKAGAPKAGAPKAGASRSAGATPRGRGGAARAPQAPRPQLVPVVRAGEVPLDRDAPVTADTLRRVYGDAQLRQALDGYSLRTLREMARAVMARNPGTRPARLTSRRDVIDYVVERVAGVGH